MTYWQQRIIDADARKETAIAKALPELLSHMQDARRSLEKEINAFYTRYATNNKITLAEAQKALSLSELADFKGDLKTYRKLAKQSIGTFNLKVDNLSVKARITRLEALHAQVDAVLQNCYQQQRAVIEGAAGALAQEQYLHALYDIEQYTGFQFPYSQLSSARIAKMLAMPVQGVDISSSLWRQDFDAGYQIRRVLNNMFTTGRPPQDFAKELQRIIGRRDAEGNLTGKTYEAYRLLYNESAHVSEQAKLAAYEDDGIDELKIDATLDSKTCHDCSPRDGKVIAVKDAVEGVTVPPFHVNCRCTTVAYIPEAEGAFTRTRAARDPVTGKTVRVKAESYEDWRAGLEKRIGADKLAAAEKMAKNESTDFSQYQKYKGILGKDAPKSFASFQDLKYNNSEYYRFTKLDYSRRRKLADDQNLRLPHAESATAADSKFTGYLFNPASKDGFAKGQAFASRLGYSIENWQVLQDEIIGRASVYPATFLLEDQHGAKYEQFMVLYGLKEKPANVVVGWRAKDGAAWMTTCYIKEVK